MTSGGIIFSSTENLITKNFSVDPASISVRKRLFSSKQHRSTRRNNSLHPGYLTSLATRTNHNTIQTIGTYVRVFRTADHAGQIFIPHLLSISAVTGWHIGLNNFGWSYKSEPERCFGERFYLLFQAEVLAEV